MTEYKCKYCGRESSNNQGLSQHEHRCKLNPNYKFDIKSHAGEKIKCPFCNKLYAIYGLKNHIAYTHTKERKPNYNLVNYKKIHKSNDIFKGRTYEDIYGEDRAACIKKKIGYASKNRNHQKHTYLTRKKISEGMKKVKAGGLRKGSGIGKNGYYKGIYCASTYELVYLIYCLDHNIKINRCKQYRKYFWNDKWRKYYPDFIVNDQVIEIKGFSNEQFKHKILYNQDVKVLFKKDIQYCFDYVDEKYKDIIGIKKDYIKLYDKKED